MQAKEIIFIINSLGGKGWGGAHRVVSILANYYAKNNYAVSIVVWRDSTVDYPLSDKIKIEWLHWDFNRNADMLKPCIKTRRYLKHHSGAYVYVFMSTLAVFVWMATRGLNVNIIASERTDPRKEPHNKAFRFLRNHVFGLMYKTVYQTPDAMNYFPKAARKNGCVIPNPVTPNLPNRYTGKRKKEFITFCRIDKQKNLPMMIDAFCEVHKKYPDYILRIYGKGNSEDEIKKYILKKGMSSSIIMEGFRKDVHSEIIDAYAFLSSSDYEGLSNSMLEALAIGLPCICTDCPIGGARMIITNSKNGILVPIGDSKAMADAMIDLIENPAKAESISIEAEKIRLSLDENEICKRFEALTK